MQDQLRTHRQILYDLALHHLEPLQGNFSRLAYLAALRNSCTGIYQEQTLLKAYGREPVHQALSGCHEELLNACWNCRLPSSRRTLRSILDSHREGNLWNQMRAEILESWIPSQAPEYLKELFRSNLNALLELLRGKKPRVRSSM